MIRLGIIGGGNIVRTRHLAAIASFGSRIHVAGISDTHRERADDLARRHAIARAGANADTGLSDVPWMDEVDAVLVATPPFAHGQLVLAALERGKHVLVEKPFVLDLDEGRRAIELAQRRGLILAVNHNFQYSRAFTNLRADLERERLGRVRGAYSLQLSNDQRRLPAWSERLPLGLFYDESPHVFYLLRAFAGRDTVLRSAYCVAPSDPRKTTPHVLDLQLTSDTVPASIHIDFESPICEWTFVLLGERGLGCVDLFRDIYTYLPHDGQHLMREVLATSGLATLAHWRGFAHNGWSYVRHRLYYGFDRIYANFIDAVESGDPSHVADHDGAEGLAVNLLQHAAVDSAST